MPTIARTTKAADAYMNLIRKFPLRPIKGEREHDTAVTIVADLMGRKLDGGEADYLDALIVFVTKYEEEHHTHNGKDMTPQETLLALMRANDLKQADIGKIIGSESAVSMFLKGTRELSKQNIKALATRFAMSPAAFF